MPFASAISTHPVAPTAVGEVVGQLLEDSQHQPDALFVFLTPAFAGAAEDIISALQQLLEPTQMIGAIAPTVLGHDVEVSNAPAISVLSASGLGACAAVPLDVMSLSDSRGAIVGWPSDLPWLPMGAILLTNPARLPVEPLFAQTNLAAGFPRIVGGGADHHLGPNSACLFLNGSLSTAGAVALLFSADDTVMMNPVLAPGARPVGRPLTVTKSLGRDVLELGGQRAFDRVAALTYSELDDAAVAALTDKLILGVVINESTDEFTSRDFVLRPVLASDPVTGAITVSEPVEVGNVAQFMVFDPTFALTEFQRTLNEVAISASAPPQGALFFGSLSRGNNTFTEAHLEPTLFSSLMGGIPLAGMRTLHEYGVTHAQNFKHAFSASIALFHQEHQEAEPPREAETNRETPPE